MRHVRVLPARMPHVQRHQQRVAQRQGPQHTGLSAFTGRMEPSQELADTYYRCTTCGTCTYFCPAQIKVPEIVASARKKLAEAGFIPEPYKAVVENIEKTGNPFASKKEDRIEVYPKELKKAVQEKSFPEKSDTLLFMGCVPSFVDMKIVPAFINNLEKANEPYTTFAMEEGCCGLPVYLSGSEAFTGLAKSNIERIKASGAKRMVTPCAGCYHSFKDIYSQVGRTGRRAAPRGGISRTITR